MFQGLAFGGFDVPEDGRYYTRELIGAIIVAAVLSLIVSSIAVYSLNRYLGPVDGSDSTASVYVRR
jgi:hypothetical protein